MSIAPIQSSRVSQQQFSYSSIQSIEQAQQQILVVEEQLSTGKQVNEPSDNPASAAVIQQLQKTLSDRQGYAGNVNQAQSRLAQTDSTLGDLTNLLQQAQGIASQNASSTATAAQRASAATVIDSLYTQAMQIANQQFEGSYLFGGDAQQGPPYAKATGGVQYVGSTNALNTQIDANTQLTFQVSGSEVFGGNSALVSGSANLSPSLQPSTRLSDVGGTTGNGVSLGSIVVSDGSSSSSVNLSAASSMQDVVDAINNQGVPGLTASLGQFGLQITGSGSSNITVSEVGGGTTAADLGILRQTSAGTGVPLNGANLNARVTPLSALSSLKGGAGISTAGFTIQNGQTSKAIALNSGMNVQDLLNQINGAGLGVRAQINSAGTGIDVLNAVQGTSMTISENGGTTATDLGIGSFSATTPLTNLNSGKGVGTVSGNDFSITTADGTVTNVDLSGPVTVQDVLNQINTAAAGKATAALASNRNGIILTDNTAGAGTLKVTPLNFSTAASDLGLTGPASGNQIVGSDTSGIPTPGIFTDLQNLRDSLRTNSTVGITTSAESLQTDSSQVVQVRGKTGALEQELQSQSARITTENTATQSLLSQLQDVDYTKAATQFQSLQTALQASLQVSAKSLNLSLMNYLS